ncbi:hypothetical protein AFE_1421 [Acidithiobacillus ferrooxidans ATCC 23270]|uniref:Uncharacterized protein n=2 Tax=root TaxID=1 RepID=B7J9L8_ACIF2|nr:hypothetical protein AFE_1421 [Acidithiobacillus ferrooxidans ATCC 23270]
MAAVGKFCSISPISLLHIIGASSPIGPAIGGIHHVPGKRRGVSDRRLEMPKVAFASNDHVGQGNRHSAPNFSDITGWRRSPPASMSSTASP